MGQKKSLAKQVMLARQTQLIRFVLVAKAFFKSSTPSFRRKDTMQRTIPTQKKIETTCKIGDSFGNLRIDQTYMDGAI